MSVKITIYVKKNMFRIACIYENGKYLASIMDDSVIMCDEVVESCDEEIKTIPTNFNENNIICKTQSFYILFTLF